MTRLGDSGIWKLFESNVISFLHLHNHKHPTEAGYSERLESSDETPRWPGDPPELCQELELQATTVIRNRMKSERGYLMLCLGVYGQKWLQAHHEARTFERALGYTYTWHTVYVPVSQSPNRNLEIKVFRPNDPCKKATVACIAINSPAFTEYNIDDKNDCLGKALRLVRSTGGSVTLRLTLMISLSGRCSGSFEILPWCSSIRCYQGTLFQICIPPIRGE